MVLWLLDGFAEDSRNEKKKNGERVQLVNNRNRKPRPDKESCVCVRKMMNDDE